MPVENIDALAGQIFQELHLIAEALRLESAQSGNKARIATTLFQIVECRVIEDIIPVVAAQQRQEVQSRFRFRGAEDGKMVAADLRRIKITMSVTGTGVIDRDIGVVCGRGRNTTLSEILTHADS
ncbi:hypothetical protein QA646_30535 (plasmid) [Rhizobium sp. CB3090]|uniref:hypothetical protein n=1 Tax=Rhizobium sp. CB3090 TaxID=3039156 RepID=UPI0024B04C75|nr:hypothetical protein [Rhizobium sp. CB3090]WFU13318.1 hypothetical protein QA646_30535 [Rhizobium sp. CB3090]